jgi:hypothetical protein
MEEAASSWHYDEHPDIIRLNQAEERENGGQQRDTAVWKVPCRSSIHRLNQANREKNLG